MAFVDVDFTPRDLAELERRGISREEAAQQLELLRHAPPAVELDRPCTTGDGIQLLSPADQARLEEAAADPIAADRVMKFVPASGAATRMFRDLAAALHEDHPSSSSEAVWQFFQELDKFPFAAELRQRAGVDTAPVASADDERRILHTLLVEMRYGELPKALIPFHRTSEAVRTPFEEHLLEAVHYTAGRSNTARAHFTVAPAFRAAFEQLLAQVRPRVEAVRPGISLAVGFSEQSPSTDTLAITPEGQPFRLADGSLLFRPSGHGALLGNLQSLGGDLVVIKNIDNVVPFEASAEVVRWKRILIGYAASLQREVCELLGRSLAEAQGPDARAHLERAIRFASETLGRRPSRELRDDNERRAFAIDALDRPLRVCGVVRNEGEPGGAPFWVVEPGGRRSLQIVEASQVDMDNERQRRIFESSTHFNPVDLVCVVRRCDGSPFDLGAYVDSRAVFRARKSHEGRDLIALERPGLWNGAMAGWNTVFVEVPERTFAPVKTVLDLLRPEHQSL